MKRTLLAILAAAAASAPAATTVSISGDDFLINGKLTCAGRIWNG